MRQAPYCNPCMDDLQRDPRRLLFGRAHYIIEHFLQLFRVEIASALFAPLNFMMDPRSLRPGRSTIACKPFVRWISPTLGAASHLIPTTFGELDYV